jgi:hypothetical protein
VESQLSLDVPQPRHREQPVLESVNRPILFESAQLAGGGQERFLHDVAGVGFEFFFADGQHVFGALEELEEAALVIRRARK